MKTGKIILALMCFFIGNNSFAQEVKFGKVSKAALEEKFNPADSSAVATYLYKYRRTYFEYKSGEGFNLVTSIHHRIKIYSQDGFDYATKKIVLYKNGSSNERVGRLKAVTYNLKNGKIEETKLDKDGEFEVALSEYRDEKSFTMPKIAAGSVIEYKYEVRSPFISNIDEFVFQHDIPVKSLTAIMDAPQYFVFRLNMKGFLPIKPEKDKQNRTLNIRQRVNARGNGSSSSSGGSRTAVKTSTLTYFSNITTYQMNTIPALKEEPYVNGIDNYRSGVTYELSYTDFPDTPIKTYATNWEAVVKTIYDSDSFGGELKKIGYFEDDVDAIVAKTNDETQKITAIFDLVKSKVKWNEAYGKYTSNGVRKAYKDGLGNVADINLMLTSMLRYAGLEANPVLVSTRANGIPLFPTREGYNYVICGVDLEAGMVLLDATDAYSTPNILPFRTLNWEGRMIRKEGTSETVTLYPSKSSSKRVFTNMNLSETGDLNGKIRISYNDHDAVTFRKSYFKADEDQYLEELENDYGQIEIDNFEAKNADDLSKPATISYDYNLENGSEVIADKLYFMPLSFLRTTTNPFTLENREFPIDFGYPSITNTTATVKLPEGYKIESMPESMSLALPEDLGVFNFMIVESFGNIQLKVTTKINNAVISPVYYEALKEYYKKMIEKMNEKVVLSKV
ncbi:DUF3857 domain-containing protein [Maribacter sp.]|nr:DUF3857 domain-containing protein [Maribacter sp.]